MTNNRVYIFDTTLRDGQQSPGAGMSFEDNLAYAEYAHLLKVDVLEAGFPAASQTDFDIVKTISEMMVDKNSEMTIASLCQLREAQIITTMEALKSGVKNRKSRVHVYVPVDPNLMQASLGPLANDQPKIIEDLYRLTKMAVGEGFEVEFSPEGYSRMGHHFEFVADLIRATISAGAKVINCPDTIGGASRFEGEIYFVKKMQQHANMMTKEFPERDIIWSAHCHNDFGLALENSITAVVEGPARQIEGCINGVGERAGNVSLEQCIVYFKTFGEKINAEHPYHTNVDLQHLKKTSDFIAEKMLSRQPHTPIVGQNAARHTSGGHTNAILKNPLVYQPFDPLQVGSEITFVFGPLSGGNHAKQIIEKHHYRCDETEKAEVAQSIKDYYADRRKGITDLELIEAYRYFRFPIKITGIDYGKTEMQHMHLTLKGGFFGQKDITLNAQGQNSVLAVLVDAVNKYFDVAVVDYQSRSYDDAMIDAKCQSNITIKTSSGKTYVGEAIEADIHISALKAFVHAINHAYVEEKFRIVEKMEVTHA